MHFNGGSTLLARKARKVRWRGRAYGALALWRVANLGASNILARKARLDFLARQDLWRVWRVKIFGASGASKFVAR